MAYSRYEITRMDEQSVQKANEYADGWKHYDAIFWCFGIVGLILFIKCHMILAGICSVISLYNSEKSDKIIRNAYNKWKKWCYRRELDIYGNPYQECLIANLVLKGCVDARYTNKYDPNFNPWSQETIMGTYLDPAVYTLPLEDGTFDYTKYIEEAAYRFIIAQKRCKVATLGSHLINFISTFSVLYFDRGNTCVNINYLFQKGSLLPNTRRRIFKRYPMSKAQMEDIVHFEYSELGESNHWIVQAWERAKQRVYEENKTHKAIAYPKFRFLDVCPKRYKEINFDTYMHGNDITEKLLWESFKNVLK